MRVSVKNKRNMSGYNGLNYDKCNKCWEFRWYENGRRERKRFYGAWDDKEVKKQAIEFKEKHTLKKESYDEKNLKCTEAMIDVFEGVKNGEDLNEAIFRNARDLMYRSNLSKRERQLIEQKLTSFPESIKRRSNLWKERIVEGSRFIKTYDNSDTDSDPGDVDKFQNNLTK